MSLMAQWSGNYVTAKSARTYIEAESIISDANKIKGEIIKYGTDIVNKLGITSIIKFIASPSGPFPKFPKQSKVNIIP